MSQKRKQPDEAHEIDAVFRSDAIEDRSSKFIGYFSPSLKPKQLQNLPEFQSASHKILGWRRESNQQSITKATQYVTGSDDDGEKYGGKKVEKVLDNSRAIGACVVARWYGGVMLGPIRFTHIESCARDAIRKWEVHEAESKSKKRKMEEESEEVIQLAASLSARDRNIGILRKLADAKDLQAKRMLQPVRDHDEGPVEEQAQSSTPVDPGYHDMSLQRLRALEKARDATLSFLLKRIDKAEAEIAAQNVQTEEPP